MQTGRTVTSIDCRAARAYGPAARWARPVAAAWRWIGACLARRRQRLALGELDERLLRDIGLTRADARRETAKHPWMR